MLYSLLTTICKMELDGEKAVTLSRIWLRNLVDSDLPLVEVRECRIAQRDRLVQFRLDNIVVRDRLFRVTHNSRRHFS